MNDLRLIGDDLYFEGEKVAALVTTCTPTVMGRFTDAIKTSKDTQRTGLYYVASLRGAGWFSKASQFNTDIGEAKEMSHDLAIMLCQRYKSNGHICVPVLKSDMERV